MDTVELIWKLEEHFNIRIPNEEAEKIATVGDIYEAICRHVNPVTELEKSKIEIDIIAIISDHAGIEPSKITFDKSITSDLGLD